MKKLVRLVSQIFLLIFSVSCVQAMDVKPIEIGKTEIQLEKSLQDAQTKYDEAKKKAEDPQKEKDIKDALDKSSRYYKLAANNPDSPQAQNWLSTGKAWENRATGIEGELAGYREQMTETQAEIDTIQGKLTALRESLPVPPVFNYKAQLEQQIIGLTPEEAQIILDDELSTIKKQTYNDQLKSLADLSEVAQANGEQEAADLAQKRISEIQTFQKQLQPAPRNELEQRLNLQNKIVSDQIAAVDEEFITQAKVVSDAIESSNNTVLKSELVKVENLLESSEQGMLTLLDSTISTLKTRSAAEISLPAEIENNKSFLTNALENTQTFLNATGPIVFDTTTKLLFVPMGMALEAIGAKAMEITPIADAVKKAGGQLQEGSQALQKIANEMSKAPQMVQRIEKYIDLGQAGINLVRPVVELLPRSIAGNIADVAVPRMEKVLKFVSDNREFAQKGANFIAGGAQYVSSLAEYVQQTGVSLQDALNTQEQAKALEQINKAQTIIDREKLNIIDATTKEVPQLAGAQQKMTFAKFFEPLKTTIASIGEYLRSFFETTIPVLKTVQQKYDDAKTNYMKLLGFAPGEQATEIEIQKRLNAAMQDPIKKSAISQANNILVQASADLADNYKKTLDTVNGAAANIEFLITGWGDMKINPPTLKKQAAFADWVEIMFDARDTQVAYLQTAMSGVKQIQSDLQGIKGTPVEQFGNDLVTRMSQLINGDMLSLIAGYARAADNLNEKLIEDKKNIQSQIVVGPGGL
jgi:hypothetical protein